MRPIWKGNISFGLVNIPVNLFSAEKPSERINLHLLDKKTHSRIHNQRVNANGKEIPWEDIEHAYEFEKGKYVIVDQKMLEQTAAKNYETVEIDSFVPLAEIDPIYFDKPYYLLPDASGLKAYMLLHDILQRTQRVGIATVVIKTREHLAAILPQEDCLTLIILRYAKNLHSLQDFSEQNPFKKSKIKIPKREMDLAEQLVENMSSKWKPEKYHDDNQELLRKLINSNIKRGRAITKSTRAAHDKKSHKSGKVLDFMKLLQQSVAAKKKHVKK